MAIEKLEESKSKINVNNHVYDITYNASKLNEFQGVFLNLNYKNVMHFFKYINSGEYDNACYVIGINEQILLDKGVDFVEKLYKYLSSERFISPDADNLEHQIKAMKKYGQLNTKQEEEEYKKQYNEMQRRKQVFCHFGDYDLINSLFYEKYRIDLEKEDISYFFYLFKLNAILEEETNALIKRISHRSFKPMSGKGVSKQNQIGRRLKEKYSLI